MSRETPNPTLTGAPSSSAASYPVNVIVRQQSVRVFHLLSAENGLSDIALRRIRISRFRDLNDPFELLAAKVDESRFRKGLRSWGDDFNRTDGLLCFSKHWENPVLWSHYAVKHRGI